jgi:hypothetical protein
MKSRHKIIFTDSGSSGFLIALFLGAWLIFTLSMPLPVTAQSDGASRVTMRNLKSRYGLNDRQLDQLRPQIERQAGILYKILSKNRDRSEIFFRPFWMDTDIWLDLQIIREEPIPNLNKSQREALHGVYTTMEKEIVLILIDEQVLMLAEEIELDSYQAEYIYNILVENSKRNRLLIDRPPLSLESLCSKLEEIIDETEIKIGKVLLPEQLKKYLKIKQKIQQEGIDPRGGGVAALSGTLRNVVAILAPAEKVF